MSIFASALAFLTAIAAKPKPEGNLDVEGTRLAAAYGMAVKRIDALSHEVKEADRVRQATFAALLAERTAHTATKIALADMTRERDAALIDFDRATESRNAYRVHMDAMLTKDIARANIELRHANWCNCVPARSQVFVGPEQFQTHVPAP